ncbi:MAG: Transglutaminase domain containing protein [Candidatus Magnetoglobus multicellularis str. Araruama]|uniref:Transglutaminase domain containing protein n=1 Tax=Candidatus Magnetoglobus multicellularis str. Araruama TaxID=890399 RepID=A0A1V1PHS2_9BACT|nr:MAG: Transglutaminase domain containing protein [Candidatus Magnetoglobus multicellularis str. Araruama]
MVIYRFFLFFAIFVILICIHCGVFEQNSIEIKSVAQTLSAQETWMNIFHQQQKMGFTRRMIQPQNDMYVLSEKTYLQVNTLGTIHDLHIETNAILNNDMSLSQFSFQLKSDPFDFKVQGTIASKTLRLVIDNTETNLPIQDKIYLPTALIDAAYALDLKPGESQKLKLFDPSTMGMRTVTLFYDGSQDIEIMGDSVTCKMYSMEFMGMKSTAWIDSDGQIVQEKGIMGMMLKKTAREDALKNLSNKNRTDLIEWVSVSSNIVIENPELITQITYQIQGEFDPKGLEGGRQKIHDNSDLSIKRERIPMPPYSTKSMEKYLQSTLLIPTDHPDIQGQLKQITRKADPTLVKIKKVMVWMTDNIIKRPVLSVPNAVETLKHKRGDCNEHAVLTAALLRVAGVPTRIVAGLVYLEGRFYYHAWNEVYLNQWVSLDVIMSQFPADVTHIRLVKGAPDAQMALLGMIGNIQIQIIDIKP